MKDLNKTTEWVCTALEDCLTLVFGSDEIINDYFIDENGNDSIYGGKNMRLIFEKALDSNSMHKNDLSLLHSYLATIDVKTKHEYIMDFFDRYELEHEDDAYCDIDIHSFFDTLGYDDKAIKELLSNEGCELEYYIASCLAEYGAKEYGGEWDYHYAEDRIMAWNKDKCEWRDGNVCLKKE